MRRTEKISIERKRMMIKSLLKNCENKQRKDGPDEEQENPGR